MATDKASADHVEQHPEHEAALTGALALANLFSNCVEAFGLIHSSQKWEREEQLALSRLGIQQARLLIWGDIVGVSSPPQSVTNHAVPLHPSSAYPDLNEPTFFQARDERLEDPVMRTTIEGALSAIVDRSSYLTREEMMNRYGLKPPKRSTTESQPVLAANRLEAFREKYELLKEVAESYAHINTRRANSIVHTSWTIADQAKFAGFIRLIQEKVDFLINTLEVKERVDRAMRMDIRGMGWHLSADRGRVAADVSKLRLLQEACRDEYAEYVGATQQALDNISKDSRESAASYSTFTPTPATREKPPLPKSAHGVQQTTGNNHEKPKRPSVFGGIFKSFRKSSSNIPKVRNHSVAAPGAAGEEETARSKSDAGPVSAADDGPMLQRVRSKSVGNIYEPPVMPGIDEELTRNQLQQLSTNTTVKDDILDTDGLNKHISRHDQYHGIGRIATKDQRQTNARYD